MLFRSIRNVKLVNVRNFTSRAGNPCTFLTLADPETYESADFMPVRGADVNGLHIGGDYVAELHYDGRYINVNLLPAGK